MGEFSRRDVLSTAVVAGAAMTVSAAEATDQVPEPTRAPGDRRLRSLLAVTPLLQPKPHAARLALEQRLFSVA